MIYPTLQTAVHFPVEKNSLEYFSISLFTDFPLKSIKSSSLKKINKATSYWPANILMAWVVLMNISKEVVFVHSTNIQKGALFYWRGGGRKKQSPSTSASKSPQILASAEYLARTVTIHLLYGMCESRVTRGQNQDVISAAWAPDSFCWGWDTQWAVHRRLSQTTGAARTCHRNSKPVVPFHLPCKSDVKISQLWHPCVIQGPSSGGCQQERRQISMNFRVSRRTVKAMSQAQKKSFRRLGRRLRG